VVRLVDIKNYKKKREKKGKHCSLAEVLDYQKHKKRKEESVVWMVDASCRTFLSEIHEDIEHLDDYLLSIDEEHGPKVLRKIKSNLPEKEREYLIEIFNLMHAKLNTIERRMVKHPPYIKKPPKK